MMNMKIDRLKALGITAFMLLIGVEYVHPQLVQAKTIPLTDLSCMAIKGGGYFTSETDNFIMNREIYTSLFRFSNYQDQEFACKLPNAKSASLDLQMAIASDKEGPFLVTIYLNGNKISSKKVFPGKITIVKESLIGRSDAPYEVGGRRTLVFQTTCLSGSGCGWTRFLKGDLNFVVSPGQEMNN